MISHKKAQVSIEFLLIFAVTLTLLLLFNLALLSHRTVALQKAVEFEKIYLTQSFAVAFSSWYNNGGNTYFDASEINMSNRPEHGKVRVIYDEKVFEVEGIFVEDSAEPI